MSKSNILMKGFHYMILNNDIVNLFILLKTNFI